MVNSLVSIILLFIVNSISPLYLIKKYTLLSSLVIDLLNREVYYSLSISLPLSSLNEKDLMELKINL